MDEAEKVDLKFLENSFCADKKGEAKKKCKAQAKRCVVPNTKAKAAQGVRCPKRMKDALAVEDSGDFGMSSDVEFDVGDW